MMVQQKPAVKRMARKEVSKPVLPGSRQTELSSPVEGLLRDLALVLYATAVVRQGMEAEQAICSTAS